MADSYLQGLLSSHGLVDDIYGAMKHSDMAKVVMVAKKALKTVFIIPMTGQSKSESLSTRCRNEGNKLFKNAKYRSALQCYNDALKLAPNNSDAIVFAYSNRSVVLLAINAFGACLKDIKTCLDMNCSKDITEKLMKRQSKCLNHIAEEGLRHSILFREQFVNDFFNFNVKRNPKIPCVSTDVDVIFDKPGAVKVVAANDIKVGTVVAVEKTFVGALSMQNASMSCYYCHKMTYNLSPCEGCCTALFCDTDCKDRCMKDYHRIECQIVDNLGNKYADPIHKLMTRAAIKMSLECETWQELITASYTIGASRMKTSTINEIYDVKNKFSILNYDDDRRFIHGKMFNGSFICAIIIDCLSKVPNYIPQSGKERENAMRALGRIMMHLYISFCKLDICSFAFDYWGENSLAQTNCGWFSFVSKLKHSCEPNLLVTGLNDKVALVALKPIERGEELNISYVPHWCDKTVDYKLNVIVRPEHLQRMLSLFGATQLTCTCRVCMGHLDVSTVKESTNLTEKQKICCQNLADTGYLNTDLQLSFKLACKALNCLRGLENTKQYCVAFNNLLVCFHYYQFIATNNVSVSDVLQD